MTPTTALLLLRRRKPVGSLTGILLAYGLFKLYARRNELVMSPGQVRNTTALESDGPR